MHVQAWLDAARRDAERRGLPDLRPLLEALARATTALREADWNVALDRTDSTGARAADGR